MPVLIRPLSPHTRSPFSILLAVIVLYALLLSTACGKTPTPTTDVAAIASAAAETARVEVDRTLTAVGQLATPKPAEATSLPAASATPNQPLTVEAFTAQLQESLARRDYPALQASLGSPFHVAVWESLGGAAGTGSLGPVETLDPAAVIERLQKDLLATPARVRFADSPPQSLLDFSFEGSEGPAARLLSYGWGPDGLSQALLLVAANPDGTFSWQGVLVASTTFDPPAASAVPAKVSVSLLNMRSGPSAMHSLLGTYPVDTELVVQYAAAGYDWVEVAAPDGEIGWMSALFLTFDEPVTSLPLLLDLPAGTQRIYGWVKNNAGQPVDQATVGLWQGEEVAARSEAVSGEDGMFYLYLPGDETGSWQAGVLGVACTSKAFTVDCGQISEFTTEPQAVSLPATGPVVIVFSTDPSGGASADQISSACPNGSPGERPYVDETGGYCFLYPEDFSTSRPAPTMLSFTGPAQNQSTEPVMAAVNIETRGPTGGRSLEALAAEAWSEARGGFIRTEATLGGERALVADNLLIGEANWNVRQVVVIHGDTVYVVTFTPWETTGALSAALADLTRAWDLITSTFHFIS